MKKLLIIAFSLMLTMSATDVAAQSLLKKFGDAVKKEIKKEVKKEVQHAVDNAIDMAAQKIVEGVTNPQTTRQEPKQSTKQKTEKQKTEKAAAEKQVTDNRNSVNTREQNSQPAEEETADLVRRPEREETQAHAPKKWAPHTEQGQKQVEEARIAKFEFIKEVDLYFADGSTKGSHKVFNDGEGLCVEIKEKHYKITACNEEFFGAMHYGYCTYLGMNLYIREELSGLGASTPSATEKATFGTLNGHDWVDLGLPSGTKWATCNIGSTAPDIPGNLYAWGESQTKSSYSDSNYSLSGEYLTEISGTSYDTARTLWGEGWTMPTNEQFKELLEYCDWLYAKINGHIGAIMTSRINQQSIFLPAAGYIDGTKAVNPKTNGNYWTSTRDPYNAIYIWIYGLETHYMTNSALSIGQSIRPVTK